MASNAWLYELALTGSRSRVTLDIPGETMQADGSPRSAFLDVETPQQTTPSNWILKTGNPDAVITVIAGVMLAAIFVTCINLKIRRQALRKQRYGDSHFPPLAPVWNWWAGEELQLYFKQCAELVGPVCRLNRPFVSGPMVVAVGDVSLASAILNDSRTRKPELPYLGVPSIVRGSTNMFKSEGPKWKTSRQGVQSAFTTAHVKRMHKICRSTTEQWIRHTNLFEPFDPGQEMSILTLKILCEAAFEYRIGQSEAEEFVNELGIVVNEFTIEPREYSLRVIFGFFLPSVRRARLARSRTQAMAMKMLTNYRRRHTEGPGIQDVTVISCIVNNHLYEDDGERVTDILSCLFCGVDSIAHSLAFTLKELARHPTESQELRRALNGADDTFAHTKLKDILREGMRLHPVVPVVGVRIVRKDFFIKSNSIVIPRGSHVIFPSIMLTRNKVEDAEEFRPSRWRDHPEKSFLLFSSGPRNCVAQGLANAAMTWILSRVCAEYDFEIVDNGWSESCLTTKCVGTRLKAVRSVGEINMMHFEG